MPDVKAGGARGAARIRALGATLVDVSLPRTELVPVYYVIAPAEGELEPVALRRRALRPPRGESADLLDMYRKTAPRGLSAPRSSAAS